MFTSDEKPSSLIDMVYWLGSYFMEIYYKFQYLVFIDIVLADMLDSNKM